MAGKNSLIDSGLSEQDELAGNIERIVFHNSENGYTVMRLAVAGKADLHTAVGNFASPRPGASFKLRGRWINHQRFGRQFHVEWAEETRPATVEGISMFLGSGIIKGIGKGWADRIVARFGTETLRVLDEEPDLLLQISGFGRKKLEFVIDSWTEHQGIRELMIFLQPHGIGPAQIMRIYRCYAQSSMRIVQENPYRLAMDIHGIGFATADALAMSLGFEKDSPLRAEAGLLYTLMSISDDGHVYFPHEELVEKTAHDLDIDPLLVEGAIAALSLQGRIVIEDFGDAEGIYITRYHHYETKIAYYLHRLLHSPKSVVIHKPQETVRQVLATLPMELAPEQEEAVYTASQAKIMVLTGGPGTGKTTIINAIIKVFVAVKAKILLAAPTGRAAKRMSETSGREAKTIHRLLEYSPQ